MAARTKPAPEVEPEATTEEPKAETPDREGLKEVIKEVLAEVLPGKEVAEEPEVKTDDKPPTAREEEAQTRNIVSEMIKAFKEEVVGEKSEAKKEPEPEPGKKPTRWIERKLWGHE